MDLQVQKSPGPPRADKQSVHAKDTERFTESNAHKHTEQMCRGCLPLDQEVHSQSLQSDREDHLGPNPPRTHGSTHQLEIKGNIGQVIQNLWWDYKTCCNTGPSPFPLPNVGVVLIQNYMRGALYFNLAGGLGGGAAWHHGSFCLHHHWRLKSPPLRGD